MRRGRGRLSQEKLHVTSVPGLKESIIELTLTLFRRERGRAWPRPSPPVPLGRPGLRRMMEDQCSRVLCRRARERGIHCAGGAGIGARAESLGRGTFKP